MLKSKTVKMLAAAVVLLVALFQSCKSEYDALLNSTDVDQKYNAAFNYFNHGKFNKAARLFESLAVQTSGSAKDDTVQFYWGMSNYRYKDYYTAETNFSKFLTNFPRSPFSDGAAFLRIDCLYRSTYRSELDQKPTYTALAVMTQYLIENPNSTHAPTCRRMMKELNDRLDKKAFDNAKLYYKQEDYRASRVAFRNILKDDSDNIYREDILYYIAMSSYNYAHLSVESKQRERYLTFVDDYYNFIGEVTDSPYRKELDVLYKRAQKALGRYSGTEEDLEAREKDFEKERKKLLKQSEENGK